MPIYINDNGVIRSVKKVKVWDRGILKTPFNIEGNVNGAIVQGDIDWEQIDTVEMYVVSIYLVPAYASSTPTSAGLVPKTTDVGDFVTVSTSQINLAYTDCYPSVSVGFRFLDANGNQVNYTDFPAGYKVGLQLSLYITGSSGYNNTWSASFNGANMPDATSLYYPYSMTKWYYLEARELGSRNYNARIDWNNAYIGGESWYGSTQYRYLGIAGANITNTAGTVVKTLKTKVSTLIPSY